MTSRVFLLFAAFALGAVRVLADGPAAAPLPAAVPAQAATPDTILDPRHASEDSPRGRSDSPGLGPVTCLAAFALAAAGVWLFVRGRGARGSGRGSSGLSIAESRPLGNRQHLVVAAYGRKRFLIGVCQGSISLLSTLDDEPPSP